ncbi:hypothetical protein COEREDRAFT_10436 [Coemansia reversa NRRL 1564]|uniref:Uncharacterized protein n=1 Tax=Coemansia reversa (strain ATCC 12441 / NRRL 1564) TaxID=763665 RepID=A0A2G5B5X0_COERN|nr:hypothetical protein COEREDRAFT_10436 [Coemansia reversa NRRL 1564]|eukprot:PIA14391.1 hypothetical protein COEREDRAFT_10436 [Coemansia reversa NRRL 1564]
MGTDKQPVASTSKGKESTDVLMAGNLSKYSTEVPKATQAQIIAPKASELLDAFKSNIGIFLGNAKKDKQSCANWITKIMSLRRGALIGVFKQLVTVTVQDLLHGDAKDTFKGEMFETLDALVSASQIAFPLVIYQQQLMDLIRSGEAFKGITRYNFGYVTKQYIDDFQELPVGLTMLADFNQFLASMTALPDKPQGLKFMDFKGIVSLLVPQEQRGNPKFAPNAVNWLVITNCLLTTADYLAKWKAAITADSLPLDKANIYYADCEQNSVDPAAWANFENAQLEQLAKAAKLCNQATMLLFLSRMPQGVISRVLMEAKNCEPIRIGAVKTLAANHFGSLAMAAHAPMEIDAVTTNAPPVETDAIRGGYRRPATFPLYNSVHELVTREQYEDCRKRDVCLAYGDAKHNLRKCPQRNPKGQQN